MDIEDETHLVTKPHLNRKHGSSENLENPALASGATKSHTKFECQATGMAALWPFSRRVTKRP